MTRLVTVPQLHDPGGEAEVDFGELWLWLDGTLTKPTDGMALASAACARTVSTAPSWRPRSTTTRRSGPRVCLASESIVSASAAIGPRSTRIAVTLAAGARRAAVESVRI